jgi:heat shock protein HtpX
MAKRSTGAQVIQDPRGPAEMWLVETVGKHAKAAGIGMPEVAIYDSPAPNAFATGARRDSALVAVSTGLLRGMNKDEIDGVLAHEVSHIANGDMVTLTLLQGVVNAFVIFFARVIGHFVDRVILKNERGLGIGYFVVSIVAQIVLGILASTIVMWFSRQREFRADAGAARLAGANRMVAALERLKSGADEPLPEALNAFGISGGAKQGLAALFASHPPLDERIARLKAMGG